MNRSIGGRLKRLARRILWEPAERGGEGADDIQADAVETHVESHDLGTDPEYAGGWRLRAPVDGDEQRGAEEPVSHLVAPAPRPTERTGALGPAATKRGRPVARDRTADLVVRPAAPAPAANETEPPSERMPDLPPKASRRRPGAETAPSDLLRVPESAGRVADEFFEGLVRRAKGR